MMIKQPTPIPIEMYPKRITNSGE
jgi:hypothetical protein